MDRQRKRESEARLKRNKGRHRKKTPKMPF